MKFSSPHWLWALLILPLIYFILVWDERKRQGQFEQFANRKIWNLIVPEMIPDFRLRKARFLLVSVGFAVLALARPQFGTHEETVNVSGLDIVVALDVSNSMDVEDVVPSRLQKAKHVIRAIIDQLNGDRVGVVPFAASAYLACPLTTNLSYVLDTVHTLGPKAIQSQGTDVGLGLQTALDALDRGGEEVNVKESTLIPSHVVILISDGEDHEAAALKVAEKFKEKGTKLYVLGVGTEAGGPIPIKDEAGTSQGFRRDRKGQAIISSFQPSFLQSVAKAADGKYWGVTTGETEVQELLHDLSNLTRGDYAERKFVVYEDRFQIPLVLAILFLILEISVPARKILVALFLFFSAVYSSTPSLAAGPFKNPPSLDAYFETKRGIEAYKKGNIEQAGKEFGTAQARDPSRPELEFNQGAVEMQKGDVDRAIESFQNAARAAEQNRDPSLLGKSLYNLGNAFAKKGDARNAAQSYLSAIQTAIESKDSALEYEARKNLQLMVNEQKQQKQQQQQQKEKEQSEQKEQKDQRKNQAQGQQDQNQPNNQKDNQAENQTNDQKKKQQDGEKSNEGQEQKEKRYSETPKELRNQPFQSKKLTPEDANRVMSELTTKERDLQEKLQAQHAKSQNNPKDW